MEHLIVKAVCGFLNHKGGTLLIGVAGDGQILGIEPDLRTLGAKGNTDGYELHLRQLLDTSLSAVTAQTVRIRFCARQGHQLCAGTVAASAKLAKGTAATGSEFWVRIGTQQSSFTATT